MTLISNFNANLVVFYQCFTILSTINKEIIIITIIILTTIIIMIIIITRIVIIQIIIIIILIIIIIIIIIVLLRLKIRGARGVCHGYCIG